MTPPALLLLDTSVFIAREQERPLDELPDGETAVSVVTLAELELGVHMAADVESRRRRLDTLSRVRDLYAGLMIDEPVASAFAGLVAHLRQSGRTARIQDSWIAATALAHGAAVCTQDEDFQPLAGVQGLRVLRV